MRPVVALALLAGLAGCRGGVEPASPGGAVEETPPLGAPAEEGRVGDPGAAPLPAAPEVCGDRSHGTATATVSSLYPVPASVHVEDPALADVAATPGQVRPTVLNAVAYARYAASVLSGGEGSISADAAEIAHRLLSSAASSGVAPQVARAAYRVVASSEDVEAYREHLFAHARGQAADAPLPRLARRVADLRAQLGACAEARTSSRTREAPATAEGPSAAACCAAMAVPWAFLDVEATLSEAERARLDRAGADGTFFAQVVEDALARAELRSPRGARCRCSPSRTRGSRPGSRPVGPRSTICPRRSRRSSRASVTCAATPASRSSSMR